MNLCGLTRVLVPAFFAGFGAAAISGSDRTGWIVAAVVGAAVWAWGRRRGTATSCTLAPPDGSDG